MCKWIFEVVGEEGRSPSIHRACACACVSSVKTRRSTLIPLAPHDSRRSTVSGLPQERPPAVRAGEQSVAGHHHRCPHASHCSPRAGTKSVPSLSVACPSCPLSPACAYHPAGCWPDRARPHPEGRIHRRTYRSIWTRAPRWASGRTTCSE
jgi:hypothetical protein